MLVPDSFEHPPATRFGTVSKLRLDSCDGIVAEADNLLLLSDALDEVEARWVTAIAERLAVNIALMDAHPELPSMPTVSLESATIGAARALIGAEDLRDAMLESSSGLEIAAILGVPYVAAAARWRYRSMITDTALDGVAPPRTMPRPGDYRTYKVVSSGLFGR